MAAVTIDLQCHTNWGPDPVKSSGQAEGSFCTELVAGSRPNDLILRGAEHIRFPLMFMEARSRPLGRKF